MYISVIDCNIGYSIYMLDIGQLRLCLCWDAMQLCVLRLLIVNVIGYKVSCVTAVAQLVGVWGVVVVI
jgi:hypothetical protein